MERSWLLLPFVFLFDAASALHGAVSMDDSHSSYANDFGLRHGKELAFSTFSGEDGVRSEGSDQRTQEHGMIEGQVVPTAKPNETKKAEWTDTKWSTWKKLMLLLNAKTIRDKLKELIMTLGKEGLQSMIKDLSNPRKAVSKKVMVANKLKKLQGVTSIAAKTHKQKNLEAKMVGNMATSMASAKKPTNKANVNTLVNLLNTIYKGGPSSANDAGVCLSQGELGRLLNKDGGSETAEDFEDNRANLAGGADGKGAVRRMISAPLKSKGSACPDANDTPGDASLISKSSAEKDSSLSSKKETSRSSDKYALLQSDSLECADEASCRINATMPLYFDGPLRWLHDDGLTHSYSHVSQLQIAEETALDEDLSTIAASGGVWPGGVIPFCFSTDVAASTKVAVKRAIKNLQDGNPGCTVWKEKKLARGKFFKGRKRCEGAVPSIVIQGQPLGCTSFVGAQKFEASKHVSQVVNLQAKGCDVAGVIEHEFLHVLGMSHEQMRKDREKFVQVQWQNIAQAARANFRVDNASETATSYDYSSVMHYGLHDFAKDKKRPSMKVRTRTPKKMTVGQRVSTSDLDRLSIYRMYFAEAKKKGRQCKFATRKVVKCTDSPPGWKDPAGNDCNRYRAMDKTGISCKLNAGRMHCCGCDGGVNKVKWKVQQASLKGTSTIAGKKRAVSVLAGWQHGDGEKDSEEHDQTRVARRKRKCCTSLTAKCASCWKKMNQSVFCKSLPSYLGCPGDWLGRIQNAKNEKRMSRNVTASVSHINHDKAAQGTGTGNQVADPSLHKREK